VLIDNAAAFDNNFYIFIDNIDKKYTRKIVSISCGFFNAGYNSSYQIAPSYHNFEKFVTGK